MTLKGTASKVTGTAERLAGAVLPITIIMSAGRQPMQAARGAGFAGVYEFYAHQVIPNWGPPTWATFRTYLEGPGGGAIMTGIGVGIVDWLINELSGAIPGDQSASVKGLKLITKSIVDASVGVAIGEASSMIVHGPSYSGGGGGGGPGIGGLAGIDKYGGEPKMGTLARKREEKAITTWPTFR